MQQAADLQKRQEKEAKRIAEMAKKEAAAQDAEALRLAKQNATVPTPIVASTPIPMPAASIEATASSGFKTKQQRLSELLDAYKRDVIAPPEYHQQRARILAEP